MWKPSRKVVWTCSNSPARKRPLSTKMHVSWSPMAACSSAAATDESTPPESPSTTWCSPTVSRISRIFSSMKLSVVQSPLAPQTLTAKFCSSRAPSSVWTTSGWNCTPKSGSLSCATAARGALSVAAMARKPSGSRVRWSPWLIQTRVCSPMPAKSGVSACATSIAWPNSRRALASTLPPSAVAMACSP